MSEELEQVLRALSCRTLGPDADARIIRAMLDVPPRKRPWWRRPIPLWQACAACAVIAIGTGLVMRPPAARSSRDAYAQATVAAMQVVEVSPDRPLFAAATAGAGMLDIRDWRTLNESKGDPMP